MASHIVDKLYNLISNDLDILRPNRFTVKFNRPQNNTLDLVHTLIQSATLPSVTVSNFELRRQGRGLKIPGGVNFSDVTLTLYDVSDSSIRNYFNEWIQEYTGAYDDHVFNDVFTFVNNTMTITQLDRDLQSVSNYVLYNVWPSSIGETELSHENNDQIITFTVAFNYNYVEYNKL